MSYYAVLKVEQNASQAEIRQAYLKLAREHHPDLNPDNTVARLQFKETVRAYEVLRDPHDRQVYDQYPWLFECTTKVGSDVQSHTQQDAASWTSRPDSRTYAAEGPSHAGAHRSRSATRIWSSTGVFRPRCASSSRGRSVLVCSILGIFLASVVWIIYTNRPMRPFAAGPPDDTLVMSRRDRQDPQRPHQSWSSSEPFGPIAPSTGRTPVLADGEDEIVNRSEVAASGTSNLVTSMMSYAFPQSDFKDDAQWHREPTGPPESENSLADVLIDDVDADLRGPWLRLGVRDISTVDSAEELRATPPPNEPFVNGKGYTRQQLPSRRLSAVDTDHWENDFPARGLTVGRPNSSFSYPEQNDLVKLSLADTELSRPSSLANESARNSELPGKPWQTMRASSGVPDVSSTNGWRNQGSSFPLPASRAASTRFGTTASSSYLPNATAMPVHRAYVPVPTAVWPRIGGPATATWKDRAGVPMGQSPLRALQRPGGFNSHNPVLSRPNVNPGGLSVFRGPSGVSAPKMSVRGGSIYDAPTMNWGGTSLDYLED